MFLISIGRTCAHPSLKKKKEKPNRAGKCYANGHLVATRELAWDVGAEDIFEFDWIQTQELDLAVLHLRKLS